MDALEAAAVAYNINAYICIDEFGASSSDSDFMRRMEQELIDPTNPEDMLIQRERLWARYWFYHELSEEAKEVLQLILDCPEELKLIIGTGKGKKDVSIKKLASYLHKQWKETLFTKKVLQEIAEYTIQMEQF